MTIEFYKEVLSLQNTFNITNMQNEDLVKLGLKPLSLKVMPMYFNPKGNIYYASNNHLKNDINNDIISILNEINKKEYSRFETIQDLSELSHCSYYIKENKIYFRDLYSLIAYQECPELKYDLEQKYNLESDYYKPSLNEIENQYYLSVGNDGIIVRPNLKNNETLKTYTTLCKFRTKKFKTSEELTGKIIRDELNHNANIFVEHICSWDTPGAYNSFALNLINSTYETKKIIYEKMYALISKSPNAHEMIMNLLKVLGKSIKAELLENADDYITEQYNDVYNSICPDILTLLLGFDKIENKWTKTITTSKLNINETFFNYLLMDYNIIYKPSLRYDENTNSFIWYNKNSLIDSPTEKQYEEKIKEIKRYIPYDKRSDYFI